MTGHYAIEPIGRATGLRFGVMEYRARQKAVREEMAKRGIHRLFVTSPVNLLYLTGYEAIWYPNRLPVGLVIDRDKPEVLVFDWRRHEGYVKNRVFADAVVLFDYADAVDTVVAALSGETDVFAIEWSSPNPSAPVMSELAARLERAGFRVVSGDWIVDSVRLYKSDAELACIREAAAMADAAMLALSTFLRPGITELEVSALLGHLLAEAGSEPAAMPALVNSGPDAWMDIHGFPSTRGLKAGDVVNVDCCASVGRYHANLGRSFVLGPSPTRARDIIAKGAGSFEVLRREAVLNGDPAPAAAAADAYARNLIPAENVWWIGGYALGLSLLPNWVGHTYLANDGMEKCLLKPGYVSNFENVFVDSQEGFEAGCIDTLIMTPGGLDLLSTLPRRLIDVPLNGDNHG